jgi:hypothetical protein
MTRFDWLLVTAIFACAQGAARADGMTAACENPTTSTAGLRTTNCSLERGVSIVRLTGAEPLSPYATEFDKRSVVFATGADSKAVKSAAGIHEESNVLSKREGGLVIPPEFDQIARRSPAKSFKHGQWIVVSERIQYAAQGGAPGFVVDCATAIRGDKQRTVAVAECFPLEERQRYLRTLESVR